MYPEVLVLRFGGGGGGGVMGLVCCCEQKIKDWKTERCYPAARLFDFLSKNSVVVLYFSWALLSLIYFLCSLYYQDKRPLLPGKHSGKVPGFCFCSASRRMLMLWKMFLLEVLCSLWVTGLLILFELQQRIYLTVGLLTVCKCSLAPMMPRLCGIIVSVQGSFTISFLFFFGLAMLRIQGFEELYCQTISHFHVVLVQN